MVKLNEQTLTWGLAGQKKFCVFGCSPKSFGKNWSEIKWLKKYLQDLSWDGSELLALFIPAFFSSSKSLLLILISFFILLVGDSTFFEPVDFSEDLPSVGRDEHDLEVVGFNAAEVFSFLSFEIEARDDLPDFERKKKRKLKHH